MVLEHPLYRRFPIGCLLQDKRTGDLGKLLECSQDQDLVILWEPGQREHHYSLTDLEEVRVLQKLTRISIGDFRFMIDGLPARFKKILCRRDLESTLVWYEAILEVIDLSGNDNFVVPEPYIKILLDKLLPPEVSIGWYEFRCRRTGAFQNILCRAHVG